jgi:hypothetical protein
MSTFLTLAQAKSHLRVIIDDDNADISLKLDQAEAIVFGYLKNRPTSIATVTAGNPAVVTTTVPHSLVTGATYTLAGTSTTPTLSGPRVVTVTGPTTFTVPVNVTSGQSAAAGTVADPVFTSTTVQKAVQAATLLVLAHIYEHRGDDMAPDENLWSAITRLLAMYRDPALA